MTQGPITITYHYYYHHHQYEIKGKIIGLLHRHFPGYVTFGSVTQNSREGTGNKSGISTWRVLNPDLTRAKNFRQLINKMEFVCVKEGEEYVMCNGTRYKLYEGELSYKDTMFWVYLGVYVGLVLFAGEDVTL